MTAVAQKKNLLKTLVNRKKFSKMKKPNIDMAQFLGPKTTTRSKFEQRLKISSAKRKIAKVAIKKAKKPKAPVSYLKRPITY